MYFWIFKKLKVSKWDYLSRPKFGDVKGPYSSNSWPGQGKLSPQRGNA